MESSFKKFLLHGLKYGAILAGVQILIQLLIYIFDIDMFGIGMMILNFLIMMALMIFLMAQACIKYRDKYLDNSISFLNCWVMGIIVGISSTLIVTLYTYVFYTWFEPELLKTMMQKVMDMTNERLANVEMSEEEKDQIMQSIAEGFTTSKMLIQSLISFSIQTLLFSLIASAFVRKRDKSNEPVIF
jgi:hypothetical protein